MSVCTKTLNLSGNSVTRVTSNSQTMNLALDPSHNPLSVVGTDLLAAIPPVTSLHLNDCAISALPVMGNYHVSPDLMSGNVQLCIARFS